VDDENAGIRVVQLGAEDYLVKGRLQAPLLGRSLRYAIERHHSAQALRKSEAHLSGVIGSAMDAIITVDDKQRIILFNPAEQTFGCKASEALGQTLDRFIPEHLRSSMLTT
jgi:PAS domain-containing protein